MSGSSTILQTLLPAKSGETGFRGGLVRKSTQSFADVFEKRIQVQQDNKAFSKTQTDIKDRQSVADRRDVDRPVLKEVKTDKFQSKNPAKEKLKELMKKVRDTLDAMKDPGMDSERLKALTNDLKDALSEIKALAESAKMQISSEGTQGTEHQEILKEIESLGTEVPAIQTLSSDIQAANGAGTQKIEHRHNSHAELKGNPILKGLEKVIEAQTDILSQDPILKDALKEILTDVKTIQDKVVTKTEPQFSEKLDELMAKLNGIVVKSPEKNTETMNAEVVKPSAEPTEQLSALSEKQSTSNSGKQDQQSNADGSETMTQPQDKQAFIAEAPVNQKGNQESDTSKLSTSTTGTVEKTDAAAPKLTSQVTAQTVPNPQAFQDTLDAVKDGVQAKTQFQSRVMEQIIESVKTNFKTDDGKSEMIMKLKPESLGNVALKVSIDRGIVLAEFQVDSQAVKQALEANLQDLRSALQDKGFNTFDLNVSVRKDNQQQQNSNSGKGSRNRTARVEGSLERIEHSQMSLESAHRESTIDYLG